MAIKSDYSMWFALIVIVLGLLRMIKTLKNPKQSKMLSIKQQYFLNTIMITMGVITLFFQSNPIFQVYPIIVSSVFLMVFASSLLAEKSMIEVFASYREKNISTEKKRYLRNLTKVWCGFFVGNIILSAYSWYLGIDAWLLYNGVISYILMGLLFIGGFVYGHVK